MRSKFVLCIDDGGEADLERRKAYRVLPDAKAAKHGMVRVIDESGEDYLYPESCFVPLALPAQVASHLADPRPKRTSSGRRMTPGP